MQHGACRSSLPRLAILALTLAAAPAAALTVDFEDVGAALPSNAYVNDSQGFRSRGVGFDNRFTDFGGGFTTWAGFAVSNVRDSVTPGYGNQYAAYRADSPFAGGTYAVGFVDDFTPFHPRIRFESDVRLLSVAITNTTYAALSMRDGDAFAKKFGGASGHDPDFFRITIEGLDATGAATGSLDFFLADYRFADDGLDYLVSDFTRVDLTGLGSVRALAFTLASSDVGEFGSNTPAYFAIDDLALAPEPGAALLYASGIAVFGRAVHRRTRTQAGGGTRA